MEKTPQKPALTRTRAALMSITSSASVVAILLAAASACQLFQNNSRDHHISPDTQYLGQAYFNSSIAIFENTVRGQATQAPDWVIETTRTSAPYAPV